ncbi:MAG: ATP-dependent DNA helicase [bacterium]|nr:ATP-dependent DNA helicase [bacterium]
MCARIKEPFDYTNRQDFHTKLVEWVGDVLYDILPEYGYEVRDEQIFTAFQVADAICKKEVHLAEAGLGTGKTFAYLLSAIPYARFTGKPMVIACATSALQEQLANKDGDIHTLSKLLGLEVDARMAKDPSQYICDVKVEELSGELNGLPDEVTEWLSTTTLGERAEIPTVSDRIWKRISWDESMGCEVCLNRGYCKLIKARENYRTTADLIIVDHETFFKDLWTREERIADGKLPILPSYSGVIFDEGHKILLPAAMQAGRQISRDDIESMISSLEEIQGARESLADITMKLEVSSENFFKILDASLVPGESSERRSIRLNDSLFKAADTFRKALDGLLLEMQIEQELYFESLPTSLIQAYEGQIERAISALYRFIRGKGKEMIPWVDQNDESFWVVPKDLTAMLDKHLISKQLPVVFTSATLSNEGDFSYFKRSMGLTKASTSTIGSPFDIENQVVVTLATSAWKQQEKIERLALLLKENGGRALVLVNNLDEVKSIRKSLEGQEFPFELLWEDQADRGYLARKFKEEETSVLIGANYWEGIDVPGESLTLVVIWKLPFPAMDPLLEEQRKEAKAQGLNPVETVDYPEMGLKLKQGCGRLIRTEEDHGKIAIFDAVMGTPYEKIVMGALPEGAKKIEEKDLVCE